MRDYSVQFTATGETYTVSDMPTAAIHWCLDHLDQAIPDEDENIEDWAERLRIELVARSLPEGA